MFTNAAVAWRAHHPPFPSPCSELVNYATYLVELALPNYSALKHPGSVTACAALYAAKAALNRRVQGSAGVSVSGAVPGDAPRRRRLCTSRRTPLHAEGRCVVKVLALDILPPPSHPTRAGAPVCQPRWPSMPS